MRGCCSGTTPSRDPPTRLSYLQVAADAPSSEIAAHLKKFTEGLKAGITESEMSFEHTGEEGLAYEGKDVSGGYFGDFGGRYIPETLVEAHRLVLFGLVGWIPEGSGRLRTPYRPPYRGCRWHR